MGNSRATRPAPSELRCLHDIALDDAAHDVSRALPIFNKHLLMLRHSAQANTIASVGALL